MTNTESRDKDIAADYNDGKEIGEIARGYGLTERRVSQILRAEGITLRPRASRSAKSTSESD